MCSRTGGITGGINAKVVAWDALRFPDQITLLVTRVRFPPGKPHGVALARWAKSKQPGVRVLFVAQPAMETYAEGLGLFLAAPVSAPKVAEIAARVLVADNPSSLSAIGQADLRWSGRAGI
jgi:hypothetical protein